LLGNAVDRAAFPAHPQLRVHVFGERGDVVDTQGHVRESYGLEPGEWLLVRPDGYVAWASAAGDDAALQTALTSWAGATGGAVSPAPR
jgi:hypothetical protein